MCSWATARPAARIPTRKFPRLICLENIDIRRETSRPYALGNICSASGPRAVRGVRFANAGLDVGPGSLSRSRLARCASTGLSVRCNFSASSFTVHSCVWRRLRILPLVVLNNRSRQPIYFIDSKIMRIPSKPKECLTTSSADGARRRSLFAEEGMTLCF